MCDGCRQSKPTTGAIINGKYGQYCRECRSAGKRSAHGGHARYLREQDRKDNERDLIQPWLADGTPNREFIREYPEEAKLNFTQEELERYE